MKNIYPINRNGNWFKGNLHCHSTMSDGKLNPDEVVNLYKEKGYSFLAFSEHGLFTNLSEFNSKDFLIMPAIEAGIYVKDSEKCYHIHGIQGSKEMIKSTGNTPLNHNDRMAPPDWKDVNTVQNVIDKLNNTGNLVMLNHPVWSLTELDDFIDLKDYFALEIFNNSCEMETKTGLSTVYWDSLLRRGRKIWGIATDDNHNKNKFGDASITWDSFGGWVNVQANELSQDAISEALLAGKFYSSTGPEIYNYGIENGEAFVECSPVEKVYFRSNTYGYSRCNKSGEPVTKITYKLKGTEKYIRIECEDKFGKTAWTNPMFISE
ncbi:hypothetical protein SAMN02745163_00404 [Clostridium cavendishii DSM 21758]|uniref:Polymerase/histidinol phosphatase N-terminal domain-containing protein n=1 Tax=Clostridium cavendishii DSM 21758 TaxID=1121302 RepID=A0A1M6BMS1_9CLOT|nr:PHP domain-containing protein [Clostridium cavendishii]SHI50100.1 hypothetical protein SAMN02745163_00404 [Clostridium cavendishii DSM 21758]